MELVLMDGETMVLSEPADGPSKFKVGETIAWMEVDRRIDGHVVMVKTDVHPGRHLITIKIDRIGPHGR